MTLARLDNKASATASPGRFVCGIAIDPANPNHAWISYSSYSSLTPATPGHVFSVTFNGNMVSPDATWTSLDGSGSTAFPDLPATDVAFDGVTGDLYASNDFGVLRKASGSSDWTMAGAGLPQVEVAGLTIVPSARKLYAATHGRSAWQLTLPSDVLHQDRKGPPPKRRPFLSLETLRQRLRRALLCLAVFLLALPMWP